jgi:hypothetical protein
MEVDIIVILERTKKDNMSILLKIKEEELEERNNKEDNKESNEEEEEEEVEEREETKKNNSLLQKPKHLPNKQLDSLICSILRPFIFLLLIFNI